MINAPIPGESLTKKPRNAPYEQPVEKVHPEDALFYHLDKFQDEVRMDAAMQLLEQDIPLQQLVEGVVRSGVANGIHSVDTSMVIAPVIHEYLKGTADSLGILYSEGPDFEDIDIEKMNRRSGKMSAYRGSKLVEPEKTVEEEPAPEAPETPEAPTGNGLMAKPGGM